MFKGELPVVDTLQSVFFAHVVDSWTGCARLVTDADEGGMHTFADPVGNRLGKYHIIVDANGRIGAGQNLRLWIPNRSRFHVHRVIPVPERSQNKSPDDRHVIYATEIFPVAYRT